MATADAVAMISINTGAVLQPLFLADFFPLDFEVDETNATPCPTQREISSSVRHPSGPT